MGGAPRRKQLERVHVGLAVADPDSEMDVRRRMLRLAGRARVRDRVSLGDGDTLPDAQGSQVRQ